MRCLQRRHRWSRGWSRRSAARLAQGVLTSCPTAAKILNRFLLCKAQLLCGGRAFPSAALITAELSDSHRPCSRRNKPLSRWRGCCPCFSSPLLHHRSSVTVRLPFCLSLLQTYLPPPRRHHVHWRLWQLKHCPACCYYFIVSGLSRTLIPLCLP